MSSFMVSDKVKELAQHLQISFHQRPQLYFYWQLYSALTSPEDRATHYISTAKETATVERSAKFLAYSFTATQC